MLPALLAVLSPVVGKILDKIPDAGKKAELQLELQKALIDNESKIRDALVQGDLAQIEVNKIEAASNNWFKSCWRPALAWVGVLAIAWAGLIGPVVVFVIELETGQSPKLPNIDTGLFMTIMTGLLGLTHYRTKEKEQGITK